MNKLKLSAYLHTIIQTVNLSWTNGDFNKEWKTAKVKPLLKKFGLELVDKNYKPVSNLCFLSKPAERCMLKQLMDHCNENNLLPDFQSAYRKHYSTETSLLKIVNDIVWNFERQNIIIVVTLDLSAAFDTVDHNVLLTVLKYHFGFCDICTVMV